MIWSRYCSRIGFEEVWSDMLKICSEVKFYVTKAKGYREVGYICADRALPQRL